MESRLAEHCSVAAAKKANLDGWYRAEQDIDRPGVALAEPFALDGDAFVAAVRSVRGRWRPLSPAGMAAVREAGRESVAPVRERQREAQRLERVFQA